MVRVISILFTIIICLEANSQSDTTIANYDKKMDFQPKLKFPFIPNPLFLTFNRIEGYTPFIRGDLTFKHLNDLNIFGNLNYSTNKNNFTYSLNLDAPIIKNKLTFGGAYFNSIKSNETWTILEFENTLAGILLHKDYMNYYSVQGYKFSLDYFFNKKISVEAKYLNFNYNNLCDSVDFAKSLFNNKSKYRINPSITPSKQNAIELIFSCNQFRHSEFFGNSGWQTNVTYRLEYGDLKNNFLNISSSIDKFAWGFQKIHVAANLILNSGDFRQQYLYGLGGTRVMKGFNPYTVVGQNLLYINADYYFSSKRVKALLVPIFFSELGKVWNSSNYNISGNVVPNHNWLMDVGIGLDFAHFIRLNLATQFNDIRNWQFSINLNIDKLN
jgi:hypothetical protein